ncbi:hypothetical protein [Candidatus Enterococcus ferrettii]|uniref:Uncharacterized protein n=1 Tax=Candidatus Enterococcus ferrettii TaxID=2815324 RepID=A0ABV0EMK0_9ENTE|nr:hypothetical protein [Enterococcus sp. 665A]MBO1341616.1 hypothetical protein [Enterococcus sp. 665A]
MIVLDYYYYSPILEKDTFCGIQYDDLQKVTKCLCIIPGKSMTVEDVLCDYREKIKKENVLLIVPDATEYNYEEPYFRKRFERSITETMTLLLHLLKAPSELPREVKIRKDEKDV